MELVYALPAARLPAPSERLAPLAEPLWRRINREGAFYPRSRLEEDEAYRQIIPYAIVAYRGRVLLLRRIRGSSEGRLVGLYSIGVGGHVNLEDTCREPVTWALYRELWEEVGVRAASLRRLGLILTDRTPVERVHAGVLFWVEADRRPVLKEREKLEARLVPPAALFSYRERMEGWSRLALSAVSV